MPHITVEISPDIQDNHDLNALCDTIFEAMAAHPAVSNPSSLKIRTLPASSFRLGTQPQSFAHANLLLLPGRDAATKADLTRTLLAGLETSLPDVGSLTVDTADLSPAYAKRVL